MQNYMTINEKRRRPLIQSNKILLLVVIIATEHRVIRVIITFVILYFN